MSITDTFDRDGIEIINPYRVIHRKTDFPETVIAVFTERFSDLILNTLTSERIGEMTGGRTVPVYRVTYKDRALGFYHTLLGGAASAALLEEIFAMGAQRVLFFGSCGSLDSKITGGHLLIPTAAYRDEGVSYHYAPAADYMEIMTAGRLADIFDDLRVPYTLTKTWTTDSFYRETENNAAKRKQDGCAVVEMECASVMAVGRYRQREVYEFLYAADCLDGNSWDQRILGCMPDSMRERILTVALETALRLG